MPAEHFGDKAYEKADAETYVDKSDRCNNPRPKPKRIYPGKLKTLPADRYEIAHDIHQQTGQSMLIERTKCAEDEKAGDEQGRENVPQRSLLGMSLDHGNLPVPVLHEL